MPSPLAPAGRTARPAADTRPAVTVLSGFWPAATMAVWAEPFTQLRLPKFFDLRADPFERADVAEAFDRLPDAVRDLVLEDQARRNEISWSVFEV